MPTLTAIAEHLNLSQPRISQLVKQGMPTTSIRAAKRWRANQPKRRAATNGKFAVEHEEGTEPISGKKMGRPLKQRPPSRTGDTLLDALNNSIIISERAFEEFEKAMCLGQTSRISSLLSVHNKSLEARFMAEKAYREEMERRGLLVDKAAIIELCRRAIEPILRRMKKLPQEKGPEANPDNPLLAMQVLENEINSIIATGRKSLETLTKA